MRTAKRQVSDMLGTLIFLCGAWMGMAVMALMSSKNDRKDGDDMRFPVRINAIDNPYARRCVLAVGGTIDYPERQKPKFIFPSEMAHVEYKRLLKEGESNEGIKSSNFKT